MRPASRVAWRCASSKYAGTVMIASVISSPSASSENSLISRRMNAEISSGLYSRPRARILTSPLTARTISYGSTSRACCVSSASNLRPTRRLTAKTVFIGLVIAWRLAICPTRRSPSSVKPTIDGVVRLPSRLVSTCGVDALDDRDAAVRRAEVDAEDLSHDASLNR